MDFLGRYVVGMRLESAAPTHLTDLEVWRCESCGTNFGQSGSGELTELPEDMLIQGERSG